MATNMTKKIQSIIEEINNVTENSFLNANTSIAIAASIIERQANNNLKRYHLNHGGFMILYMLMEKGGSANITEITKKLYLTRQAVSSSTRILENQGLIERAGIKSDKRKLKVMITDKGLDLVRTIGVSKNKKEVQNIIGSILTPEEADNLAKTLNQITVRLSRIRND